MPDRDPSALGLSSSDPISSWISSWPTLPVSACPGDDPSISTSSLFDPSLSLLPPRPGTRTVCGNGEVGSGFCDDMAAWNEALVGVVASSIVLGCSEPAIDRGVAGDAMSLLADSGFGDGKFTGRKAFAIFRRRRRCGVVRRRWAETARGGGGERRGEKKEQRYAGTAGCGSRYVGRALVRLRGGGFLGWQGGGGWSVTTGDAGTQREGGSGPAERGCCLRMIEIAEQHSDGTRSASGPCDGR